jgi:hypothetical protein
MSGNGNGAHKGIGDRIRETLGLGTAASGDDVPSGSAKVIGGRGSCPCFCPWPHVRNVLFLGAAKYLGHLHHSTGSSFGTYNITICIVASFSVSKKGCLAI